MPGLGLGIGLHRGQTYPPVSAWPTIADIPQGVPVLDTDGVVKQKRVVANLDGIDLVTFPFTLPADGTTGPWELEWLMAIDGVPAAIFFPLVTKAAESIGSHWRIQIDPAAGNSVVCSWRLPTMLRSMPGLLDGKFHRFEVVVASDRIGRFIVDGIQAGTDVDLTSWAPGVSTAFAIQGSAASGTKTFTKIANVKVSRNRVFLANIPFNDGAGAICSDVSGNGNNGAISDVHPLTFWDSALVPVSML